MYLIKYRLASEEKEGAKSSEVYARIRRLSNGRLKRRPRQKPDQSTAIKKKFRPHVDSVARRSIN
jgi:hypothetical protein